MQCGQCQKKKKSHTPKCCKGCNKEGKVKKPNWSLRFNCAKLKRTASCGVSASSASSASASSNTSSHIAASHSKAMPPASVSTVHPSSSTSAVEHNIATTMTTNPTSKSATLLLENSTLCSGGNVILVSMNQQQPLLDFSRYVHAALPKKNNKYDHMINQTNRSRLLYRFNADDYPIEDCDKKARLQRALEIAEGVDPPPGFTSSSAVNTNASISEIAPAPTSVISANSATAAPAHWHMLCSNDAALRFMLPNLLHHPEEHPRIHSQVCKLRLVFWKWFSFTCDFLSTIFLHCNYCLHYRWTTSIVWCQIWSESRAAHFIGAKWTVMKPNDCWTASPKVHFCCVILPKKSSYFLCPSASTVVRFMPVSNISTTSSGKCCSFFYSSPQLKSKWKSKLCLTKKSDLFLIALIATILVCTHPRRWLVSSSTTKTQHAWCSLSRHWPCHWIETLCSRCSNCAGPPLWVISHTMA